MHIPVAYIYRIAVPINWRILVSRAIEALSLVLMHASVVSIVYISIVKRQHKHSCPRAFMASGHELNRHAKHALRLCLYLYVCVSFSLYFGIRDNIFMGLRVEIL